LTLKSNFDGAVSRVSQLGIAIGHLETAADLAVYRLYGLTFEEIAALEESTLEDTERKYHTLESESGPDEID